MTRVPVNRIKGRAEGGGKFVNPREMVLYLFDKICYTDIGLSNTVTRRALRSSGSAMSPRLLRGTAHRSGAGNGAPIQGSAWHEPADKQECEEESHVRKMV